MLELGSGSIPVETKNNDEYDNRVQNLNDLIYQFKRMLKQQYNLSGYICITEDQGAWDGERAYLPVQLMSDDFVTVFQDEGGN